MFLCMTPISNVLRKSYLIDVIHYLCDILWYVKTQEEKEEI